MLLGDAEVVYHYNPTSNRNESAIWYFTTKVVYHYNPTSNRNSAMCVAASAVLYIIIILHQTATL